MRKGVEVGLTLIDHYDRLLKELELYILRQPPPALNVGKRS